MSNIPRVALIVGVTGVAGLNLARKMLTSSKYGEWIVYGISRSKSPYLPPDVRHVSCDLIDAEDCRKSLASLDDITHVFYTSWIKCKNEEENCVMNNTMFNNLFDHLPAAKIRHVVLLTGFKHYLGPFSSFGKKSQHPTPYKETFERLPNLNFYYNLEDLLFERAKDNNFTWSVARPNTIIGFGVRNAMNFGMSIAVYASICKYAGKPFAFPGNEVFYDALIDVSDADLLAEHMMWEAVTPVAANQAFNVVNGGVFRWRHMWKHIADYFDLEVPDYPGHTTSVEAMESELEPIWEEMKSKFGLQPLPFKDVTTFWLMDVSFSKVSDYFGDMNKSRELGFLVYQDSEKTYKKLFDHLKQKKFIP